MEETKLCGTCGVELTEENKHYRRPHCIPCVKIKEKAVRDRRKDKKATYCKATRDKTKIHNKTYYDKNKEDILIKSKERKQKNKERYYANEKKHRAKPEVKAHHKKRSAEYYQEHIEAVTIQKAKYYQEHKEQAAEQRRSYRKANPDKAKAWSLNYRSKKKGLEGTFTGADIEEMWLEQLGKCVYCKCSLNPAHEVDHIIPVTREGSTNWPSNLQILCPPCNSSKGNKTHEEYLEYQAIYKTRPVVL